MRFVPSEDPSTPNQLYARDGDGVLMTVETDEEVTCSWTAVCENPATELEQHPHPRRCPDLLDTPRVDREPEGRSMMTPSETKRALVVEAEENLTGAYRALGDAADCLRGLGFSSAIEEIGQAKNYVNNAKNELRP
jgi:hypothetical protein